MDLALEAKSKFDSNLNFKKIDKKIVTFLSEESIVERTSNCTSYFDQHIFPFGSTLNVSMNVAGAVLVAQLVEWLLPILEVCGSNPVIGKILFILNICLQSTVYWKDENKEKEAHFLKKSMNVAWNSYQWLSITTGQSDSYMNRKAGFILLNNFFVKESN